MHVSYDHLRHGITIYLNPDPGRPNPWVLSIKSIELIICKYNVLPFRLSGQGERAKPNTTTTKRHFYLEEFIEFKLFFRVYYQAFMESQRNLLLFTQIMSVRKRGYDYKKLFTPLSSENLG